jgi:putative toxin-antitoxin system antitoxin component (TIGR02293 family)
MSDTLAKRRVKKASGAVVIHKQSAGGHQTKIIGSGAVSLHTHGPLKSIIHSDPANLIQVLENGLPVRCLIDLQASLDVPVERLAPMLGISKATFHRRKGAGEKLGTAESDRVVRFARLLGKAIKVFGNEEDARQWLNSQQFGLGGAVPLDYARTEVGAREVENLLGRIEYGVYS